MPQPVSFPTAERCITMAYRNAGILARGDTLDGEQLVEGLNRLNDMISLWQTQGLKLFLWQDIPVTLVQGQSLYTLSRSSALRVLEAYFLDATGIRRPLIVMAWEEWLRLPEVTLQGAVNSYFVDKQAAQLNVHLWMAPDAADATGTAHFLVETPVTQVVSLTDTSAFPPEWFLALQWGLADELSTSQPTVIMQRCQQKALYYRDLLEAWDVEDAPTQFVPDSRWGTRGGFR